MNNEKYLQNVFDKGLKYGPIIKQYFIEECKTLQISSTIQNKVIENVSKDDNFEITILEMQSILPALEKKITELLKHPDFNPFKEKLREKFPEQYGSQPFEYKGTTYYLYHKGREFYIDSQIYRLLNFKKLVEEHIKANIPLRYVFEQ